MPPVPIVVGSLTTTKRRRRQVLLEALDTLRDHGVAAGAICGLGGRWASWRAGRWLRRRRLLAVGERLAGGLLVRGWLLEHRREVTLPGGRGCAVLLSSPAADAGGVLAQLVVLDVHGPRRRRGGEVTVLQRHVVTAGARWLRDRTGLPVMVVGDGAAGEGAYREAGFSTVVAGGELVAGFGLLLDPVPVYEGGLLAVSASVPARVPQSVRCRRVPPLPR